MKKILGIVGMTLFGIVMACIIAEVGLRIYLNTVGTEEQRILYLYSREEINTIASRFVGKPYINYGLSETYGDHNSLGYRGAEINRDKPEGTFRIVALGGSTTYGVGIPDAVDTYPAQLEAILNKPENLPPIEVINAGVPSYTTWESSVNFIFRVLDLDPDLIIIYHGVNDIGPRLGSSEYYDGLNSGRGGWKGVQQELPWSVLYRFIVVRQGWQPAIDTLDAKFNPPEQYQSCGLVFDDRGEFCQNLDMSAEEILAQNPPTYFERNINTMISVAQSNEIEVMLSTWAYSSLEYPEILGGDFMLAEFRQSAIAEHNTIVHELAERWDVLFYDLVQTMPEDRPYWVDGLHVSAEGARFQAEVYAKFLLESPTFP